MTVKYITMNNRTYTVFFNNGSSRNEREVSAMIRTANKQDRLVTNPVTLAKAAAIAMDIMHTEALKMDEEIEWAKNTPEQQAIHDERVIFGISLKGKYNADDVLEACHTEALEMNAELDKEYASIELLVPGGEAEKNRFKFIAAKYIVGATTDAAHAEALEIDAQIKESRRVAEVVRAEFYLHNAVVQRDYFIPKAHEEALEMAAKMKI